MTFARVAALSAMALFPLVSQAEIVTFSFSANVNYLAITHDSGFHYDPVSSSDMPGKTLTWGDRVTGQIVYDTSVAASPHFPGADANTNIYYDAIRALNFQFQPSGLQFNGNSYSVINVAKNPSGMALDGLIFTTEDLSHPSGSIGQLGFMNTDHPVLPNLNIPSQITLSDFPYAVLLYSWMEDGGKTALEVTANIDSLTRISPVPEPEQWAMLAMGGMLLAAAARRKHS